MLSRAPSTHQHSKTDNPRLPTPCQETVHMATAWPIGSLLSSAIDAKAISIHLNSFRGEPAGMVTRGHKPFRSQAPGTSSLNLELSPETCYAVHPQVLQMGMQPERIIARHESSGIPHLSCNAVRPAQSRAETWKYSLDP